MLNDISNYDHCAACGCIHFAVAGCTNLATTLRETDPAFKQGNVTHCDKPTELHFGDRMSRLMFLHDPFQWPADYGYKRNQNISLNFRANMVGMLLKINGY